jgi:hypothetical protein
MAHSLGGRRNRKKLMMEEEQQKLRRKKDRQKLRMWRNEGTVKAEEKES